MNYKTLFQNRKIISLNINLNNLLFLFYFLSFGIYGSLTPSILILKKNIIYHTLFEFFIFIIPVLYYLYLINFKTICFKIYLDLKTTCISLVIISFFSFLHLYPTTFGLFSDEQSYVMSAHEHARKIILIASSLTSTIDIIPINYFARLLSFFICIYVILNFYIFNTLKPRRLLIYVLVSIFIFRLIFISLGGHMSPHPTMNLLPLLFTGTFFGLTPFVFKFSILTIFIFWLVYFLDKHKYLNDWFHKYLLIILISTLPVIFELKHTVEPSLWTFMLFFYVCVSLLNNGYKNYNRIIMITILVCFFRQPAFLALIPIFISELFYIYKRILKWKVMLIIVKKYAPFLLFTPYLMNSVFLGSGTTGSMLESPYQQFDHYYPNLIEIYNYIIQSIPIVYLFIITVFFLFLFIKDKKLFSIFSIFFLVLAFIFYSIIPSAWGLAKYQAEYIIPFFITGIFYLTNNLKIKLLKYIFIKSIILLNIYYIIYPVWSEGLTSKRDLTLSKPLIYPGIKYNYRSFISELSSKNELKNSLFLGAHYKLYPLFSSNISLEDYNIVYKNNILISNTIQFDKNKWNIKNLEFTHINNIIIEYVPNRDELIKELKILGWKIKSILKNKEHNTSSFWLQKP